MNHIIEDLIFLEDGNLYDPYNNKKFKGSILIENGIIQKCGDIKPPKQAMKINCKGKLITS